MPERPRPGFVYEPIKRAIDVVGSVGALIILAELLGLIAVAIKLESPGPVFFSQERLGRRGRVFRCHKLRTMRADAESQRDRMPEGSQGPVFKLAADPRLTRVGRVLRRFSLDEIPQFYNVLRGEMSLVGPRPLVAGDVAAATGPVEPVERYEEWQRRRLEVRPGITGLWQVSGRNTLPLAGWVRCDLEYLDRRSLGLDLAILLRTLPVVLSGRGAY